MPAFYRGRNSDGRDREVVRASDGGRDTDDVRMFMQIEVMALMTSSDLVALVGSDVHL